MHLAWEFSFFSQQMHWLPMGITHPNRFSWDQLKPESTEINSVGVVYVEIGTIEIDSVKID